MRTLRSLLVVPGVMLLEDSGCCTQLATEPRRRQSEYLDYLSFTESPMTHKLSSRGCALDMLRADDDPGATLRLSPNIPQHGMVSVALFLEPEVASSRSISTTPTKRRLHVQASIAETAMKQALQAGRVRGKQGAPGPSSGSLETRTARINSSSFGENHAPHSTTLA